MPANSNAQAVEDAVQANAAAAKAQFDAALSEFKERAGKVAQETLQTLRTHAGPYVDDAGDRLTTAEKFIIEKVQKQPLTTTLAALGIGVLVGLILAGGRSR